MDTVEYDEMFPTDLRRILAECPVAYLPLGTPEMHGEHLSYGQDGIKAHELCKRVAQVAGGAVMPVLHVGTALATSFNFGNIHTTPELTRALYREYLQGIARIGFRVIIALTGHYPACQVDVTKHAAVDAMETMGAWIVGLDETEPVLDLDYTGDHAGKWETSIYWHLRPDLVRMDYLPTDPEVRLIAAGPEDPRVHASPKLGETICAAIVERPAGFVGMLLEFDRDPVTHGPTKTIMVQAMRAMAAIHARADRVIRTDEHWRAACAHFYAGQFGPALHELTTGWELTRAEMSP